jgi:hypothetical protein
VLLSPSSLESLRRVFRTGFSAHDITEPIVSCDQSIPTAELRRFMETRHLEVIGMRDEGLVTGYVERQSLGDGPCAQYVQGFDESQVIPSTAPLADVVAGLKEAPRLFVSVFGQVGGIVTRTDLQKPPVRMWLFGMVTLTEMRMSQMIEQANPGGEWQRYLSDTRRQKAETLLAERTRRNQQLDLIDCLQLSDKCQIIARNEELRASTRFTSRRQVEEAGKKLERLRNNLAHAQDIITTDWEALIELTENFDNLLKNLPVSHGPGPSPRADQPGTSASGGR